MSLPEAAKALDLAPSTLRHQIKNGKLAARKVSRDWYVTTDEVERYRRENKVVAEVCPDDDGPGHGRAA